MSGSAPSNDQAVQFEQQQAAEADQKEADRQARLTQGQNLIDQIFNGSPVTKPGQFDWSTFNPTGDDATSGTFASGVPTGYTAVAAGPGKFNLKDASGKVYTPGSALTVQQPTGQTTGGFDDDFYNKYNQEVLDYYQPDEAKQYSEAQRDLTYNLARAGTLQSSTAADKQGDLAYNDALQKANIVANANTQTGNLKNQIQSNKESLINQLYATEDPTLTANLAELSANATRLQSPNLTPAAALFTPALSAVGSVVSSLTSPYSNYAATGSQSPVPASSTGTGSGVLKGATYV